MRIAVIVGTRPEAIKLAPVILALRADPRVECRVCVTGQHRQMLAPVLEAFDLVPDLDLDVMRPNQSLAGLTARLMEALDACLAHEPPHLVLVQGDTTSVFCGSLAAFYRHIPVGHVEAGLRTGNLQAPWPEEANRVLTSRLATLHFAPTESARANLVNEGVPPERIWVTGNTVIDALAYAVERVRRAPPEIPGVPENVRGQFVPQPMPGVAGPAPRPARPLVLITGHRRENFGAGFESICRALARLAGLRPDVQFVYPVHLNPNVREPVQRILGLAARGPGGGNLHLIDPLPYLPFVALMDAAAVILTDSGGIQEEAPSLGKPVLVMRETTERPEALTTGLVELVGTDADRIVAAVQARLQVWESAPGQPEAAGGIQPSPFGDGRAAARIVQVCRAFIAERSNPSSS